MFRSKARGVAFGVIVQEIGHIALLPQFDVTGPVARGQRIAHAGEQITQRLRLGMGEFDKLKPISASRIGRGDRGLGGGMRKRTHDDPFMLLSDQFIAGTTRAARILGLKRRANRVILAPNRQFARIFRMLDATDTRLLQLVQANAMLTAQDLGAALNLSASQAARRRQRLEAEGFVTGYAARIDPARVGLTVQAFIQVQFARHDPELARSFATLIATLPEVISAWTLTGEADYLLRVWCADLPGLNRLIHERLLPHPAVARVQSQIVMDQLKADAPLPIRV